MKKNLLVFLMLLCVSVAWSQRSVSGTVKDGETGETMPGVSVAVKGTTVGTITDIDGKFEVKVNDNSSVVTFSFMGYTTYDLKVGDQTIFSVALQSSAQQVEEVIVVAYGTTKKASFTGSAATVSSKSLSRSPVITVDQALAGRTAGVTVSGTSGQPGASASIRIRGTGSINSSNEPLYIVDGVALTGGGISESSVGSLGVLSTINVNDIASMTILKDAAASALYGSRAANGVILITTKSGKAGKTKFTIKSEFGINDFAVKTAELASPSEALAYKIEGYKNYLLEYDGMTDPAAAYKMANDDIRSYFSEYDDTRPDSDYDWDSELFRKGYIKDFQFSATGGNEKTKFFASLGYIKSEGVAVGSDFERMSGRLKVDHEANDVISIGFNSAVSYVFQNILATNGYYYTNPMYATRGYLNQLTPIKDANGEYSVIERGSKPNLVKDLGLNLRTNTVWQNTNQAYLNINILEGLTFRSTNSMDHLQIYGHAYFSPLSKDGRAYNGYVGESLKRRLKLVSTNIFNFSKTFSAVHNVDILAGYEVEKLSDQVMSADGQNLPNDVKNRLDVAAKPTSAYSNVDGDRLQSVLSRINYNFNHKYYLSTSFRADQSSRLGVNNSWGNFYSVSGSWRISEESFMKNVDFVNSWKVRSSFGVNGTLPSSWVGSYGLYSFGADYNSNPGSRYTQIANADLEWEKNSNFNFGTDIKMFGFLYLELEIYNKKTTDLLLLVPTSRTTGFSSYWDNVGEMTNRGVELSISSENIITEDFSWTTSLILSHNTNTIDKLVGADNTATFPFILREGESYNSIFVRDWAGVNPETGHGQWYLLDKDENRIDLDKDGKSDVTENTAIAGKKIVGKFDPLLDGSLTNSISFLGFDLSFMFTFRLGGDVYLGPHSILYDDGANLNAPVLKSELVYWKNPGDVSDFPKVVYSNPQHTNYNSSRRMEDGSYLRLKNLSFAYNLPKKISNKINLDAVKFYVNATNLLTWSFLEDFDPEVTSRGVAYDSFNFPTLKTITFGIQVNF